MRQRMWSAYHWYRRQIDLGILLALSAIAIGMGVLVAIWWVIP